MTESIQADEVEIGEEIPAQCPLSHRVARRFFSTVIAAMLILLVGSLIFVFVIQR